MDNSNIHNLLYEGLKMLGFEKYLKSIKSNNKDYSMVEFNCSTFIKANQKAFEIVTYFLFNQLKSDYVKSFRGCYPCLDSSQVSTFRQNVISLFKELEKDANFNYKFLPGVLMNPGGDSFVSLYIALLNYVLKKQLNIDDLNGYSIDDLLELIDNEKSILINNCDQLTKKAIKDEDYCFYFDTKFNNVKLDEQKLIDKLNEKDEELLKLFNTNNIDELKTKLKTNYNKINSHKLRQLYEYNEEILKTEISEIENRTINLSDLINDKTLLPIDLDNVKKLFEDKLNNLREEINKDKPAIEEANRILSLKSVCYSSSKFVLNDLANSLEKKINHLIQETDDKKLEFLERKDIQKLLNDIKSSINFKPPILEIKAERNDKKSTPELNITKVDQTLFANKSAEDDFNLSINLAEITDYLNENDESYMFNSNRTTAQFKPSPSLDRINE